MDTDKVLNVIKAAINELWLAEKHLKEYPDDIYGGRGNVNLNINKDENNEWNASICINLSL